MLGEKEGGRLRGGMICVCVCVCVCVCLGVKVGKIRSGMCIYVFLSFSLFFLSLSLLNAVINRYTILSSSLPFINILFSVLQEKRKQ